MSVIDLYDRAASTALSVVDQISEDKFGQQTPCAEWDVRALLGHMVQALGMAVASSQGEAPAPLSIDDDPRGQLHTMVADLRKLFTEDGMLTRNVQTPVGEQTGEFLVQMVVNELVVHAWDAAKASGQSTDLDPELSGRVLAAWKENDMSREGSPFGEPKDAPADAPVADQLAAYLGRTV